MTWQLCECTPGGLLEGVDLTRPWGWRVDLASGALGHGTFGKEQQPTWWFESCEPRVRVLQFVRLTVLRVCFSEF